MRTHSIPRVILGFAVAAGATFLFAIGIPFALFFGFALSGAICGSELSADSTSQYSAKQAGFRFGIGFLIGGCFIQWSVLVLALGIGDAGKADWRIMLEFYCFYVLGFTIAGLLAALITRSRLLTARDGALIFGVAGSIGGLLPIAMFILRGGENDLGILIAAMPGLLVSFITAGALSYVALKNTEKGEGARRSLSSKEDAPTEPGELKTL